VVAARLDARKRLHELRNALLDEEDAGTIDPFDRARLNDVERELDALDALDVASMRSSDAVWAKIEALAARVVASAPEHRPS
jgi:hypothetical protein